MTDGCPLVYEFKWYGGFKKGSHFAEGNNFQKGGFFLI